ncbi:MAG TPA: twin-arginine translocase subunit TatC [Candidatus Omnitrophota bacterium]|nr:twin-arginine translocase subunit TatC [Candidatus Omnitrophota bacterium]HPB68570.1 twin-arginine translocase subunit TatC [Candidatus Omnitrophota bacterium]HQO58026.1 twin-arginine translocase subunit TatC [Candidatus Omnitrophota bacterium]HQP11212.1 twin-arginine translocase subunit TatC [Candidatus Omnitrophota bacterium]
MNDLYPPESQHLDIIGHLEELRRRILVCLGCLAVCTAALFAKGGILIQWVKQPVARLVDDLIFITPTEVFVSYLKVVLLFAFVLSFPVILYETWAFFAPAASQGFRKRAVFWLMLVVLFFLGGIGFAYKIALPAALRFLFAFGQDIATPQITLAKYISFFVAFMVIGGVVFETPVLIGLFTDMGFLNSRTLSGKRKYAFLFIMVFSAVITPTQDMFNMLVFAVPMVLLFEVGIVVSRFIEKLKHVEFNRVLACGSPSRGK